MRRRRAALVLAALALAQAGCSAGDDDPAASEAEASAAQFSSAGPPPPAGSASTAGSAPAAGPASSASPALPAGPRPSGGPGASAAPGSPGGLGPPGGGSGSTPPAPSATSGLGAAPPSAAGGTFAGKRQVFLLPLLDGTELPDSVLAVTASGRVQVTEDYGERALFVPVPPARDARTHMIKTGTLRGDGRPLCLRVSATAGTVVTAGCDARDPAQLFSFEAAGENDAGRTTYAVRNRDAFLRWHPMGGTGLVAEKLGDAQLETTFTLLDRGAASLPKNG